jgi:hypothetical protein
LAILGARAAGAPVGETGAMTGLERHMGVLELAAQSIAAIDSANFGFGSTPEVSRGHGNVRSWG